MLLLFVRLQVSERQAGPPHRHPGAPAVPGGRAGVHPPLPAGEGAAAPTRQPLYLRSSGNRQDSLPELCSAGDEGERGDPPLVRPGTASESQQTPKNCSEVWVSYSAFAGRAGRRSGRDGELHESEELARHLPAAGRQTPSPRGAERPAEVPDRLRTRSVSEPEVTERCWCTPPLAVPSPDGPVFSSGSWFWTRWTSWTAKLRTSSTPSLNGRSCPSPASVSSVKPPIGSVSSSLCLGFGSDYSSNCRYRQRSGPDGPDPAAAAGPSPLSPPAAALCSLQPGRADRHREGPAGTGMRRSGSKASRAAVLGVSPVFAVPVLPGVGRRGSGRFCGPVLCQKSVCRVRRRQESSGHLQVCEVVHDLW